MSCPGEASTATMSPRSSGRLLTLVVGAPGVLEAHFENIGRRVLRVLLQPGCFVQFVATLARLGCDPFGGVVERAAATDFGLGRFRIWFGVIHWSHKFR